jgi:Na+-driven multidrug efflux pump
MGVAGAAVATMVCQMISFLILFLYGCRVKENIRIQFKYFSPSLHMYYEMFRGGIPALLRQGMTSVSGIIINRFAGSFGDAAIASISIVNRVYMFSNSLMMGFGQGFQPVCGFNFGAKLYGRVKQGFWFCARLMFSFLVVVAVIMIIFAPNVIAFSVRKTLR